jgi:signal peptidase I
MFPFTPRYLKHAKMLRKGVTRFLDYKRDLLPPVKLEEITGLRSELDAAIKARNAKRIEALSDSINKACERALPEAAPSWIADNVEVLFVAIVIALGIRGYIATLFQIPTGSMQPTLNGITAVATAEDPRPGAFGSFLGWFKGERYLNVVSDHEGELVDYKPRLEQYPITEDKWLIFMPYSVLHFKDGHKMKVKCPQKQLLEEMQLATHINSQAVSTGNDTPDLQSNYRLRGGEYIKKGQLLARGILRNGDHVLVNKFAYHFRAPKRGEVFVFTTQHIRDITVKQEEGSQHYIKRLAGVPGDHLEVRSPKLFINGKEAEGAGFKRVMQGTFDAPVDGYRGYSNANRVNGYINEIDIPKDRYFAMGDNSYNSSDSRYFGTVPDRNLVGPALFCYWPLTKHWGAIE